jgi:hypothetical protein
MADAPMDRHLVHDHTRQAALEQLGERRDVLRELRPHRGDALERDGLGEVHGRIARAMAADACCA